MVEQAIRALQDVDPTAFLVLPRVLRRLIKHEHDVPGFGLKVPHRKSAVLPRRKVIEFVEADELGIDDIRQLPEVVILLTRPDEKQLAELSIQDLMHRAWRLLFHARIHKAMDALKLTQNKVRERIDRLGQVEFDEIHAVLKRERFLFPDSSLVDAYVEFVAVYCEFRKFAPHWLRTYFPSLLDLDAVDRLISEDVDFDPLFRATQLVGAPEPYVERFVDEERVSADKSLSEAVAARSNPKWRKFQKLAKRADRAAGRGNDAGAAIYYLQAARFAPPNEVESMRAKSLTAIDRMVTRLQDALKFADSTAADWRDAMAGLAAQSLTGFWNADKRLLYDLQRVCVDNERDIYTVDLVVWMRSLGKRPIKRSLPNQREVLMAKHLHSASKRLRSAKLPGGIRPRLSELLHEAADSAEHQLRRRLKPHIHEALEEVGLQPSNLPERVSYYKLVEELLDCVVQRGFLTMGYFRDAISRNNVKMEDLCVAADCQSIPYPERRPGAKGFLLFCVGMVLWLLKYIGWSIREFYLGDKLLQADRRFSYLLDGVYHSGESYLRGLQRLSLLGFGTQTGRFLTKFVTIPFAGAYVILEGLKHIVDGVSGNPHGAEASEADAATVSVDAASQAASTVGDVTDAAEHVVHTVFDSAMLTDWPAVIAVGFFLMGVIHSAVFRRLVVGFLKYSYRAIRYVLFDFPNWVSHIQSVRRIWRSRPMRLFRRFVLTPAIITFLICVMLPWASGHDPRPTWLISLVFLALNLVLNSRAGRDVEEVTVEWIGGMWHRLTVGVLVGLFDLVMSVFKRFLEAFEKVLYAVDEWLRFKSGESTVTLAVKGVLGIFWSVFVYVSRFIVNLLVEPQVNPIKHFPVVTVSHKIILPLAIPPDGVSPSPLGHLLIYLRLIDSIETANYVAGTIVWLIPGIFGFLVWELKSNWQLYEANRSKKLKPVLVGDHGETLGRLMKPGFHSGTLPKLFAKMRRAQRKAHLKPGKDTTSKFREHEHHLEVSVRHFVERELVQLLVESQLWGEQSVSVDSVDVASNSIIVRLDCELPASIDNSQTATDSDRDLLTIAFQEQSGWLVAGILESGWLDDLPPSQRSVFSTALSGFYQLGGVDIVREQVEDCFADSAPSYDLMELGLAVWPTEDYSVEVVYNLHRRPQIRPTPRSVARDYQLPNPEAADLVYCESNVEWTRWVEIWEAEQQAAELPAPSGSPIRVLPRVVEKPQSV